MYIYETTHGGSPRLELRQDSVRTRTQYECITGSRRRGTRYRAVRTTETPKKLYGVENLPA